MNGGGVGGSSLDGVNGPDVVLVPPERCIGVPWPAIAAAVSALHQQPQQVEELLQLTELLSHTLYAGEARRVIRAMHAAAPQLSEDERLMTTGGSSSSSSSSSSSTRDGEPGLLPDSIVGLLLRARYSPLTAEEFQNALDNSFTFDIPVDIDLRVCDPQLLAGFWQRHEQEDSSLSSPVHTAMPPREALPAFSDRLLVFHRGVGVAQAPGLYLPQKLDLLIDLALRPVSAAVDSARAALAGLTGGLQRDEEQPPPRQRQRQQPGRVYRLSSLADATASDSEGDDAEQPALRAVLRHSLRSLMPDAGSVLRRFWEPLVLQEPTYRSVVVLYRQTDSNTHKQQQVAAATRADGASAAAGGASSSQPISPGRVAKAAKAVLQARAGDVLAAGVAVVAAEARAAAAADSDEGGSARHTSSSGRSAASTAVHAARESRAAQHAARKAARAARAAVALQANPANAVLKSFAEVPVADLELVMPSKQVQVRPVTLIRSAVLAVAALSALAGLIQQSAATGWRPSLLLVPAFGLVAGRAVRLLTTIKSHQAALTSTMLSMVYSSARDSQDGVLCKLVHELRDNTAKEAALVLAVLLAATDPSGLSRQQLERECEAFLQQQFDVELHDTLDLLVQWGVVTAEAPAAGSSSSCRYAMVPLPDALDHLRGQSLLSYQASISMKRSSSFCVAATRPGYSDDDNASSNSSRGNSILADVSRRGRAAAVGVQRFAPVSRSRAGRMPSSRVLAAPARPCGVGQLCLF